jgi:hypothetical protein
MKPSQAAHYLGFSSTAVLRNIPVRPIVLTTQGVGCGPMYDSRALDAWIDTLSALPASAPLPDPEWDDPQASFDRWREQRETRRN